MKKTNNIIYIISAILIILILFIMYQFPIDFKNDYLYYITIPVAMVLIIGIAKLVKWVKNIDLDVDPNE